MINEPVTGPLLAPTKVTSCIGVDARPVESDIRGNERLAERGREAVAVGVKALTTRPRVVMALLVPVMVGLVEAVSVAVIVWLPPVLSVVLKVWTPLSLLAPVVNV